jgi:hypothetical protein
MRRKGLELDSRKAMKVTCKISSTPSTRTRKPGASRLEHSATAAVQPDSIKIHSSIEPSCEPQVAAILYCSGSRMLEFSATLRTEKSLDRKLAISAAKAAATRTKVSTDEPASARDRYWSGRLRRVTCHML